MLKKKYILLFLLLQIKFVYATHIVGGAMYYDCLGNDAYRVTIKVYRDCSPQIAAGLDNPLSLGVFAGSSLFSTKQIPLTSAITIPATSPDPCVIIPAGLCIEEGTYITTLTLPARVGGYTVSYQRCCRNASVINLVSSANQGATYSISIPTISPCNSSPRFSSLPPAYICVNTPFTFNYSATDPDGDALVYSLCTSENGGDQNNPAPNPPSAPPYLPVNYASGFSSINPIAANPAASINSSTGQLTLKPTQLGYFVVTICVSEYRNGIFLGSTKREYQFNVVSCNNVIAAIPSQTVFCNGYQVNFSSAGSINATRFDWDFGVTSLTTDVSTLTNPVYFYPDSGVYNVRLIATSSTGACKDTAYSTFRVYPLLAPTFNQPISSCIKGNSYNFNATGSFTSDATFQWNFGSGANITSSTQKNNSSVFYTTAGTKVVSLTVSQYGCTKTVTKTFIVYPSPEAKIGNVINQCTGLTVQLENLSTNSNSYFWDFGVTYSLSDTSSLFQPQITYPDSATYLVRLIATNTNGCKDTVFKPISVYHLPNPDFIVPPQQCIIGNNFSFLALGSNIYSTSLCSWTFQNANPSTSNQNNPTGIKFSSTGLQSVTLTVVQKGCSAFKTKQVELISMPEAGISDITQYCIGLNVNFSNISKNATSFEWDFGITTLTTDVSNLKNPSYQYPDSGKYTVTLVATNQGVCKDTIKEIFYVYPLLKAYFDKPKDDCLDINSYSFLGKGMYGTNATYTWSFEDALPKNSTIINPNSVVFQSIGVKKVALTYRENGCEKSYTDSLRLYVTPKVDFESPTKICSPFQVLFKNTSFAETDLKYLWDFGDGIIDTTENPLHTFSDSGYYNISLTAVANSGCLATITKTKEKYIYAEYTPIASFTVTTIDTVDYRPVFQFNDKSKFATSCLLDLGNGIDTADCNLTNYYYPKFGIYNVKQIVTNSLGCRDEIVILVNSKPELLLYTPNSFTPNGDGINDVFLPRCGNETEFEIEIYNRWGEKIYVSSNSKKGWKGDINDNVGDLAPQGVYIYHIKLRDYQGKPYVYTGTISLIR